MQVTRLNSTEMAACIVWGSTVLLVSVLLKLTPEAWAEKIPVRVDENKAMDPNDPLMKAYNKSTKGGK